MAHSEYSGLLEDFSMLTGDALMAALQSGVSHRSLNNSNSNMNIEAKSRAEACCEGCSGCMSDEMVILAKSLASLGRSLHVWLYLKRCARFEWLAERRLPSQLEQLQHRKRTRALVFIGKAVLDACLTT